MKKITLLFCFVILVKLLSAQDIINMKDGTIIKAKITDTSNSEIKYLNYYDLNGPTYTLKFNEVKSFTFEVKTVLDYKEKTVIDTNKTIRENNTPVNYDIIVKTDGTTIKSKVVEITTDMIKYRNFDQPNGPIRNIPISEVDKINYPNGTNDIFEKDVNDNLNQETQINEIKEPVKNDVKEPNQQTTVMPETPKVTDEETKYGYQGFVGFGFAALLNNEMIPNDKERNYDYVKFIWINGCRITHYLSLGIGSGIKYQIGKVFYFPLYGNFKVNFLDKKVTPYVASDIGYTFGWDLDDNDFLKLGFLFSPSIGVTFKSQGNKSINLGINYELMREPYNYTIGYYVRKEYKLIHYMGFGINFGF
jgi:hypothetical protein